jgi:hypothetical protein
MKAPRAAHSACFPLLFSLFSLTMAAAGQEPYALTAAAEDGAWTSPLPGPAPPIRYAQAAIYDPIRDRMVVFGGLGESGLKNDVWSLSMTGSPAWTEIVPAGHAPTPRYHATAVYDPVRDRMLVFGGWDKGPTNDVWALSLSGSPSWSKLSFPGSGQSPEGRYQHTAIYDPVRDRMVVLGGSVGNYYEENVWALDLAGSPAWHELPAAPTSHWLHTAIYDPVRDRMVVFGGYSDGGDPALAFETDQTWEMSFAGGGVWSQLTPAPDPITGTPPDHRGGHVAVYDPTGDRMLVFGGQRHYPFSYLNDVWTLTLGENPAWKQLAPAGTAPDPRNSCTAIVRDDGMLVFAGEEDGVVRNDLWKLSLAQLVSTPRENDLPRRVDLALPRPNPSRGETTLSFDLAQPARVVLDVFDPHGRFVSRVADAWFPAGRNAVTWMGDDERGHLVGSGVYYVQMQAGAFQAVRRTVRVR